MAMSLMLETAPLRDADCDSASGKRRPLDGHPMDKDKAKGLYNNKAGQLEFKPCCKRI